MTRVRSFFSLAAILFAFSRTLSLAVDVSIAEELSLKLPDIGSHRLRILWPTVLELTLINTKAPDPARVDSWDWVDGNYQLVPPAPQQFLVLVGGQAQPVQAVGFKRRPLYAPLAQRDLRIGNYLYLRLGAPIADQQPVQVVNPDATLWSSDRQFTATTDPLRYSPAIHVNQAGYLPAFPKQARIGYFLGSLGELDLSSTSGFTLVDAVTGTQVFQGALVARPDVGYNYTPLPYQKVWEADFSGFTTPGEYQLVVPGLGASLPFLINEGVGIAFARTYALGLYHQRCGMNNALPFTRYTHDACHTNAADVPTMSFTNTQIFLAQSSADYVFNPRHTAPQLKDVASSLYPFVNQGKVDVAGGHHDAGDYSKYTINSAGLIHHLMFAVDSLSGVGDLGNLGLPESGDGIGDLLQEAKWEADFLARLQDADGGFYFLVYPRNRRYESNVLPDQGDPQVVWPKTTAVTAAAVAALAQCASSPRFKQQYPQSASNYLAQARLGWQFLTNAIAAHGKDGAYQKITHYGNDFMHDDELAWAACELFLATGEPAYQAKLFEWFPDPASPATFRWGWWRLYASYGNAIRSYAFAARSGRLPTNQLASAYLSKCEAQIVAAGNDALIWSRQNAYGTSFPTETKRVRGAGWYFSGSQAFDLAVAAQLDPRPEFVGAILDNLSYEAGGNPVNVSYLTGLGWKRQREIVHQYAQNDRRALPPSGIPLGNIQANFDYLAPYRSELGALTFPQDGAAVAPYPFYDRWADSFNVTTEFVVTDQARGLATAALLAASTSLKTQAWTSVTAQITGVPAEVGVNAALTASLQVPGLDLGIARIVWEARDQEPAVGTNFTFAPSSYGPQWVEVEAQWPDGRRVFAATNFFATNDLPTVTVAATDPATTEAALDPVVFTFTRTGDTGTALTVRYQWAGTALKWTDYRRLEGDIPEQVTIPAGTNSAAITIYAVSDADYEGDETILLLLRPDPTYNLGSPSSASAIIADDDPPPPPTVTVTASDSTASRGGTDSGVFMLTRSGDVTADLMIYVSLEGTAVPDLDYVTSGADPGSGIMIPAGSSSATLTIIPLARWGLVGTQTVELSLVADPAYTVGLPDHATVIIAGNGVPATLIAATEGGVTINWSAVPGRTYRVARKDSLSDPAWMDASGNVLATETSMSWTDHDVIRSGQRFYVVYVVD